MSRELSNMSIESILIGDRRRKDMGDLDSLVQSIEEVGLLQPVVVHSGGMLIAGARRIEAFRKMNRGTIPCYVANDLDDARKLLIAERDENTCRKDFTPTEAVAVGKRLEAFEAPAAQERINRGRPKKSGTSGNLPEDNKPAFKRETREIVGEAVGMSGTTYQRAKAVVDAAKADPEKFGDLPEKMDKEGVINRAYTELVRRKVPINKPINGKHSTTKTKNLPKTNVAKAIRNAIGTLIGITSSLITLDAKDANLTVDEAKQFDDELVGVVATIRRLRRQLMEVFNGN